MKQPTLQLLEELARQAGSILLLGLTREKQVEYKGVIDPVTDSDRAVEKFLLQEIRTCFKDHGVLAEESGEILGDSGYVWYIDPLDGTVNYTHQIPYFCVSIGFAKNGRMQLGVVYDPVHDECFSAELGQGATLNGISIQVSAAVDIDHSLLATEFGYDVRTHAENNLDQYGLFTLRSLGVRRIGSAALDLCYVACGRFDGYWELRVKPWDLAAGGLIAEEAGARVTKIDGGEDYVAPPCSILAASPGIYPQMRAILINH